MAQNAEDVSGIALGLTLDAGGFSAGINRAISDLERLRRAANIEIGVNNRGVRGGGGATGGVTPAIAVGGRTRAGLPEPALAITPTLSSTRQSVRSLRVDINEHFRAMSTSGEAVQIPVKLGRIPYAQMRREISMGIGEVPITVRVANIAQVRNQIVGGGGGQVGGGGAGGPVAGRARGGFVRGPISRQTGGAVSGPISRQTGGVVHAGHGARPPTKFGRRPFRYGEDPFRGQGDWDRLRANEERHAYHGTSHTMLQGIRQEGGIKPWSSNWMAENRREASTSGNGDWSAWAGSADWRNWQGTNARRVSFWSPQVDHAASYGGALLRTRRGPHFTPGFDYDMPQGNSITATDRRIPTGQMQLFGEDRRWHGFRRGRARYRGGPTLAGTFPNARIDLSQLDRKRRLSVGKRALQLGQEYPHTAKNINLIEAISAREMGHRSGDASSIGYTERGYPSWRSSRIMLNKEHDDRMIRHGGFSLSGNMADVFAHEYGHAYSLANGSERTAATYADSPRVKREMKQIPDPSWYAGQDPHEKFAELFLQRNQYRSRHNLYGGLFGADRKRAGGGPVQHASGGIKTYAEWAQERHQAMGGSGKLKILPAEEATAIRGTANVRRLIESSQRHDPALSEAGRLWYTEQAQIHDFKGRSKALGVSTTQYEDVLAILSSGQEWYNKKSDAATAEGVRRPTPGPNIRATDAIIGHLLSGKPLDKSAVVTAEMLEDARRYLIEGQEMNKENFGPKRSEFAAAFRDPNRFPIDRWQGRATTLGERHGVDFALSSDPTFDMAKAVKGKDWTAADAPSPSHRRASVYAVQQAAAQLGIEPRGVQAESWTEIKRLESVGNKSWILDRKTGLVRPRAFGGPTFGSYNSSNYGQWTNAEPWIPEGDFESAANRLVRDPKTGKIRPTERAAVLSPNGGTMRPEDFFIGDETSVAIPRSLRGQIVMHNHPLTEGRSIVRPSQTDINSALSGGAKESWVHTPSEWARIVPAAEWHGKKTPIGPISLREGIRKAGLAEIKQRGVDVRSPEGGRNWDLEANNGFFDELYEKLGREFGFQYDRGTQKRMAGGPISKTLTVADPNGLHMRPSAAIARAVAMHDAQISGSNLTNGQQLVNPNSLYDWMTLGARKGHKLQLNAEGPEAKQAMDLLAKMLRFNPEKNQATGLSQTYSDFYTQLGVENPLMAKWKMGRRAAGGPIYATGELGPELFVPRSLEHTIPPDVMARIPQRAQGGMVEIPRADTPQGNLWQAPEDGWIIPNHLMNKVPRAHRGAAPHDHPHPASNGRWLLDENGRRIANTTRTPDPQGGTWREALFGRPRLGPPVPKGLMGGPQDTWASSLFGSHTRPAASGGAQHDLQQTLTEAVSAGVQDAARHPAPASGGGGGWESRGIVTPRGTRSLLNDRGRLAGTVDELFGGGGRDQGLSIDPDVIFRRPEADELRHQERMLAATSPQFRGLNPRTGIAGKLQYNLGGGKRRRQSLIQAAEASTRISSAGAALARTFGDPAAKEDPLQFIAEQRARRDQQIEVASRRGETERVSTLRHENEALATVQERYVGLLKEHNEALTKGSGIEAGFLRNFTATQAAFIGYGVTMQALGVAIDAGKQAITPVIDQWLGFQPNAQRQTTDLASKLPEAGTLQTLMGQIGTQNRLSAGATNYLTDRLGGGIVATSAAQLQGGVSDLFRAAYGGGGPQGLYGGYGGVLGSPLLAQQLGGGMGFSEGITRDISAFAGGQPDQFANIGAGLSFVTDPGFRKAMMDTGDPALNVVGQGLSTANGPAAWGGQVRRFITGEDRNQPFNGSFGPAFDPRANFDAKGLEVTTQYLDDLNDAAGRAENGIGALGKVTFGFAESAEEQATAMRAAAAADDTAGVSRAGQGIVTRLNGQVIGDAPTYQRAMQQAAQGRTMPSRDVWMQAQAQQLAAAREVRDIQLQDALERSIPAALGAQVAQNGVSSLGAGITNPGKAFSDLAKGIPGALRSMKDVQGLQNQLVAGAQEGIRKQAAFIGENSGAGAAAQYTGLMGTPGGQANTSTVSGIGQTIANINDALGDRQAAVSRLQYANQIRIVNRSIGDALGLLGRAGGSELGNIERQQYLLSRQSQALSLEANRLEIAMRQRQINFQVAVAGFQAPGITGQERAARRREAEIEASYAQKQLNIDKSQQGISEQQYGLSGRSFGIEAARQLTDLQAQRTIVQQSFALEQQQLAANKQISQLAQRQAQLAERATAIIGNAEANFAERVQVAGQYVAQFGGAARAGLIAIGQGISAINHYVAASNQQHPIAGEGDPNGAGHAMGIVGDSGLNTTVTIGEAGRNEKVAIVRNPRTMSGGGIGMGGMGGGVINLGGVHVTVQGDVTDDALQQAARKAADMAIDMIGRKAGLYGLRVA